MVLSCWAGEGIGLFLKLVIGRVISSFELKIMKLLLVVINFFFSCWLKEMRKTNGLFSVVINIFKLLVWNGRKRNWLFLDLLILLVISSCLEKGRIPWRVIKEIIQFNDWRRQIGKYLFAKRRGLGASAQTIEELVLWVLKGTCMIRVILSFFFL